MSRTRKIERSEIGDIIMMQTALGLLNELNEEDVDGFFELVSNAMSLRTL